jgi:flagellar biosynthetic protein FliQ
MTSEWVTRLMTEMLWTGFIVSAPLLGLTTAVGVLASVVQVVTQLSEAALSFVPKLVAAGLALVLFGPWMLQMLARFAVQLWTRIPQLV